MRVLAARGYFLVFCMILAMLTVSACSKKARLERLEKQPLVLTEEQLLEKKEKERLARREKEKTLGVNSYLWRASLDTLSFLPLLSADPIGGVIISDWYSGTGEPNERFKLTIYILDRDLRVDALRVGIFRQRREGSTWRDMSVSELTRRQMEDAILTRARELKIADLAIGEIR